MRKILYLFFLISICASAQKDKLTPADSLYYSQFYQKASQLRDTDLDSALYYYQKLERFLAENDYSRKRFRVMLDIGNVYLTKGQSDRALETYLKIAEASELDNDAQFKLYAEISIASIYLESEEYQKALDRYKSIRKTYVFSDSAGTNLVPYSVIYNNEGIANENLGNFEEAEKFYQKAIELSEEIPEKYYLANAFSNMGSLYTKKENYREALRWHEKALELRKDGEYSLGICQSMAHIGQVYGFLDDIEQSEKYLRESLDIALKLGYEKQVIETTVPLKEIYQNRGDYASAFRMQELEMESRNEVLNKESVKNQERLKAKYEYDLEKKIEEKNRKFRETVYLFIFGGLVLLLIIAIILYLLQKSKTRQSELLTENVKKEKHLLHQELDYKNKKLMSNLMFLLEKNELISHLIEKLREAKKLSKVQEDKAISGIIRELRNHHNKEAWEEFDLYFQEVHSEFYEKLSSNYQLTPNELKLAAFTKLKLSSKEISSLTGQSIRTIDVGRYRLRKKLGITNSEINLTTFLNSL